MVSKNDRVWPKNAIIIDCRQTHGTVRKGHKIYIFQVPFPSDVHKLCSDKTKNCLDIGPAYKFLSCDLYV